MPTFNLCLFFKRNLLEFATTHFGLNLILHHYFYLLIYKILETFTPIHMYSYHPDLLQPDLPNVSIHNYTTRDKF